MGVKISELAETISAQENNVLPIVQNGQTKKIQIQNLMKILDEEFDNINTAITSLQSEINNKNIITGYLVDNHTIVADYVTEDIKSFSEYNSVGDKLSIVEGVIKIGAGVNRVKASYHATSQNATNTAITRIYTYLMQNDTYITQESHFYDRTNEQITVSCDPIILDVNEGDIFYLRTNGLTDGKIVGGNAFCFTSITIEVVN